MIGKSVYAYLHPHDRKEFNRQLWAHPTCSEDICSLPSVTVSEVHDGQSSDTYDESSEDDGTSL